MANSKANIYPIQLQGAQLNLNQFDAEIKQYSGFNKNNSPFVGGCLSNIFTKDVHNEGAAPENTYIDSNGDVYIAASDGVYKNNTEKVLDIESDKLYNIQEVTELNNYDVVAYFDDNCFCYKVKTSTSFNFYFRYYDFNSEEWKNELLTTYPFENLISFDCKRVLKSEGYYIWSCGYEYADITNTLSQIVNLKYKYFIYVSVKANDNVITGNYTSNEVTERYQGWSANQNFFFTLHSLYNSNNDKFYVVVFPNALGVKDYCDFAMIYTVTINVSDEITFSITSTSMKNGLNTNIFTFADFDINNNTLRLGTNLDETVTNQDLLSYYVTQNKFYLSNYFRNNRFNSKYVQQCDYKIEPTSNFITIELVNAVSHVPLNTGSLSDRGTFEVVLNKFGLLAACVNYNSNSKSLGYCDFQTNAVSLDNGKKPHLYIGCVSNKIVLMNNELVSGMTLPDTQSILFTDWNSVKAEDIFLLNYSKSNYDSNVDEIVFYKANNKYYKLVKTDKVLMKYINGLLITNCDTYNNCYDLKTKEKKLYAPSWNNRCPFAQNNYYAISSSDDLENKYYFASSINEYNLQENSSLILNPVAIVNEIKFDYESYRKAAISEETSDYINIFFGTEEIKYLVSVFRNNYSTIIRIDDLIGLPFPSDTNGNVQYSPSLFSEIKDVYGNKAFIKNGNTFYPLMIGNNSEPVMSFYLASGLDNLKEGFVVQGQFYGIIGEDLYAIQYSNDVVSDVSFVVSVRGLKFCGNTPYQAFFFSPTNRCLYSFSGANVLNQAQFIDKFSDVTNYKYNPATQTIFMITASEVIAYSSFGIYEIFFENVSEVYILEKGICMLDNSGNFKYLQYYSDTGYDKQNITLETCFYGTNDQTVSINDCLYIRLFDENHTAGNLVISASTLTNEGRTTEDTTFKIKASDWDELTHSIYLRYQPKEQRGLGVSFSINSPFKIASLSVGSMPDAILIDKVSKGAINAPYKTTSNKEW